MILADLFPSRGLHDFLWVRRAGKVHSFRDEPCLAASDPSTLSLRRNLLCRIQMQLRQASASANPAGSQFGLSNADRSIGT
jgi:hypothetical protein